MDLSESERDELHRCVRSQSVLAADARRARLILMLNDGESWAQIRQVLGCSDSFISRWSKRFDEERLAGLYSRHCGQPASKLTPKLEARIVQATRKVPNDGSTHWSTRRLGARLGVSHMMVARVWAKHGLKPHRLDRYMASNDPDFESKAADIIGLYLNPPAPAAVFCVDEKTAIQALDRKDPVLPLSPGRAERHGFEYFRHGTLSLYAAFNTKTGEGLGKTTSSHTSAEFVAFLGDIAANQPRRKQIHVIADNLSAHKTKKVAQFLADHPNIHLHYTPTAGWAMMKSTDFNENTALPSKTRELIGLAVAAQIPCQYCVYYHIKAAKAAGASEEELREAVHQASLTRHWSTILYGNDYDLEVYKSEIDAAFKSE